MLWFLRLSGPKTLEPKSVKTRLSSINPRYSQQPNGHDIKCCNNEM